MTFTVERFNLTVVPSPALGLLVKQKMMVMKVIACVLCIYVYAELGASYYNSYLLVYMYV